MAAFVEGPDRNRAVAAYGSVAGIGTAFGLVLGGLLADLSSWRFTFAINVPRDGEPAGSTCPARSPRRSA